MLLSRFRTARAACAASLTLSLAGCIHSPLAGRAAAFSTAANAAVLQTGNAYDLVNQAHLDAAAANLVVTYGHAAFEPEKIAPALKDEDLSVRRQVLNALSQYATLLAEVSGSQPITDLQTQVQAAGKSLTQLGKDSGQNFMVTPEEKDAASLAIASIGDLMIRHAQSKKLPPILDDLDPPIQKLCLILEDDIGTPNTPGLAGELHRSYNNQIAAQRRFLELNQNMSAAERRAGIEVLPKLITAQRQADQTLAATRNSLAALAATHAALTATKKQKDSPVFRMKIAELIENTQETNGLYKSLSK